MKKTDFNFDLPPHLVAQEPLKDRSSSRLLVLDKKTGAVEHKVFKDIRQYFQPGDVLVLNNTKVIPARLFGHRQTGGKVEVLLLKRINTTCWECLLKPARRLKIGEVIQFHESLQGKVVDVLEDGNRMIEFIYDGVFENILDKLGQMPLPPYITKKLTDKTRYQTVYAKHDGSAAAPTAGLHFTSELLAEIKAKGVEIATLTLHVGLGTFRPVKEEDVLNHKMHSEYYILEQSQADIINRAKRKGKKVYAVGTTSCRTLESVADDNGVLREASGWTDIFIYPGYSFKVVDGLITNFHLPESTLVMLVSALSTREDILRAYHMAIQEEYRFFSFGDAMLIH